MSANELLRHYFELARHEWISENITGLKPSCIVVKTTQDCNLRCKYCYTEGGSKKRDMSPDMVVKFFDQAVIDNGSPMTCIFHGGEPLLRPKLIDETIEKLNSRYYGPRIKYQIQTNATLITDEAVQLIKKHHIGVGVSIDGNKSLNDHTRYYPDCSSSYENVVKGMNKLHENGISFGILALITKFNVNNLTDILDWCTRHGIERMGFNLFTPLGYGRDENLSADQAELIRNVKKEIDWLIEHNEQSLQSGDKFFYEREIEAMADRVLRPQGYGYMCKSIPCGAGRNHLALDVDGSINVCDCFYEMDDYIIGNINTQSLEECLKNPIIAEFQSRSIDKLKGCKNCDIKDICHGGCPGSNVLFMNGKEGLYTKSVICDYFYEIYNYLIKKLKTERINPVLLTHAKKGDKDEQICCQ